MRFHLVFLLCAALMGGSTSGMASPVQDNTSSEAQGHADRMTFEAWIGSLNGDERRGADFWAAERSKPKPVSCIAVVLGPDYTSGCQEAQRRLAVLDVRRKTEPDYRKGWNAPLADAAALSSADTSPLAVKMQPLPSLDRNSQAISSAVGLLLDQVRLFYPNVDCFGDLCGFGSESTPQEYCPRIGPCRELTLIIQGGRVKGFMAEFNTPDWTRSLETSTTILGKPKKEIVSPNGAVSIRNDYWSWPMDDGLTLTYSFTSGVNAYGAPLDVHGIMLAPAGTK